MKAGAAVAILLTLAACGGPHHTPLLKEIEESKTAPAEAVEPIWVAKLKEVDTVQVRGIEDTSSARFNVLARSKELLHAPCRNCHLDTFTLTAKSKAAANRRAHRDVELNHASSDVMTCATCHNYGNVDFLRKNNGESVSFDHAYQVCRSCHFQQFKDWAGGAHGKRHAFWQGPRVIRNCTGCHNPHKPAFEKRWPVTYPSIPRKYHE